MKPNPLRITACCTKKVVMIATTVIEPLCDVHHYDQERRLTQHNSQTSHFSSLEDEHESARVEQLTAANFSCIESHANKHPEHGDGDEPTG